MKRVLITGARGFVGRHCLAPLVEKQYEVHAVSRQSAGVDEAPDEVRWHSANLLEKSEISSLLAAVRPTHFLHCAWFAVPGEYWTSPENFRWVETGQHLLDAFADYGGRRFVGVGSCAEYQWTGGICSEQETPLKPATVYGRCKNQFDRMLESFGARAGVSTAWGRLFFLYGPHEPKQRLVASVIRAILADQPALCSHGKQIRDFLYIQDAADALVALLDSDVQGPINIASGVPIAVAELVKEIAKQLERPALVKLGALPAPQDEPAVLLGDTARLSQEVRWSPQVGLKEGLARTINWWNTQQ